MLAIATCGFYCGGTVEYEYIKSLKSNNPALRVISSESAPLVLSFFHKVFIEPNRRSIPHQDLLSLLEDELFRLRESYGEDTPQDAG